MTVLVAQEPGEAGAEEHGERMHPILTEVLFNIPPLEVGGDVNLDSLRSNTGDEFLELMNPHEVSINLKGYKITDADRRFEPFLEFEFPELIVGPGETVVVFNGFRSDEIPGHDGTADEAPDEKNPHFNNAWVFRIDPSHGWQAFQNEADFVVLWSPDGEPIEAVEWGDKKSDLPRALRNRNIYSSSWEIEESFQRIGTSSEWAPHTEIDGKYYSPGLVPSERDARMQRRD